MSLEPYGFDPDKILAKAPEKIPETSQRQLPYPDIERKYNICEMTGCCKKAVGHFGSIHLCWDHGKHIEKNWKNQFGTNWYFVYWKNLDRKLNNPLR